MRLLYSIASILYLCLICVGIVTENYIPRNTVGISSIVEIKPVVDLRQANTTIYYKKATLQKLKKANAFSKDLSIEETCLALNIYHEARGSSRIDQIGVASTTLNRMDSPRWADNVCDVVYHRWAFSWTMDRITDVPEEKQAWTSSKKLAKDMLQGKIERNTEANHYYNPVYASPKWAVGRKYKKIGSHKYLTI